LILEDFGHAFDRYELLGIETTSHLLEQSMSQPIVRESRGSVQAGNRDKRNRIIQIAPV